MKYISIVFTTFLALPLTLAAQEPDPVPIQEPIGENGMESMMALSNQEALRAKQESNWTELLAYGIGSQRLGAVKQMRALKATNMIPSLQSHFARENLAPVKEEILYILMEATNSDAAFWEQVFTEEKDLIVLQRAAYVIETLKAPDVSAAIYNKLTNERSNQQAMRFNANAVRALGELQYADALPLMVDIATNRDLNQDYRGSAVLAIGIFKNTEYMELLNTLLTNIVEPRSVRRYAALGIGRYESPEATEILVPIASNEGEEQSIRTGAIAGLGYAPTEENIAVLETLTRSDNTTLRTEAVKSLGRMRAEASQEILKFKAFKDPEGIVRREARTALQAMGVDVDALEKEMRNPNPTPPIETAEPTDAANTETVEPANP